MDEISFEYILLGFYWMQNDLKISIRVKGTVQCKLKSINTNIYYSLTIIYYQAKIIKNNYVITFLYIYIYINGCLTVW